GDVDACFGDGGGDQRHDADPVVVAHDQHRAGEGHVDVVVVDHDDAGVGPQPRQRAGQGVAAAAEGNEVHVVVGGRRPRLAHVEPPLLGQLGGVDVGDG